MGIAIPCNNQRTLTFIEPGSSVLVATRIGLSTNAWLGYVRPVERTNEPNVLAEGVIFDMDGVLIDSEPLWRRAEIEVLNAVGAPINERDCETMTGVRIDAVVRHWFTHFQIGATVDPIETSKKIVDRLCELILLHGEPLPGVLQAIQLAKKRTGRVALCTSSPMALIHVTLARLKLEGLFDTVSSAETLEYGKPHPEVYLRAAKQLGAAPERCIAIEDSLTGLVSAKAARMKTIVVTNGAPRDPRMAFANTTLPALTELRDHMLLLS